jgi:sigma-B regulation protein RsbU (phosphoserine phosphatase)
VRLHVEPPFGASFDHDLVPGEVIMGRSASAGLVINDASVSRQHARFVHRDNGWWIEDLGATNRTLLNGELIEGSARINIGDRLRLGGTTVHVLGGKEDTGSQSNSRVFEDVESRQAARLAILIDIHRALATALALPELLQLVLDRCFDVLKPEEGMILLRGANDQFAVAASRRQPGLEGEMVISRRIIDEVAGKSKPALVFDAAQDDRFASSDSIVASGIRSVLAAPLSDSSGTLGLIALCSRASVRRFTDQDLDMLVSLAAAAALRVRNVALTEEAAARKVLDHELAIAHEIQMAMLPRDIPERPEVALAARLQPARSVGGDLYDFVLDDGRLWFIVGDVAGKSVAAALYMAVAKTLFRATVTASASVADVVARMNRELCRDNERQTFVTAIVGSLTLATGEVTLVDAGHLPVVVIQPDRTLVAPLLAKCVSLGVVEDYVFGESRFALAPGATLLLYTDGTTDARNGRGEQFGVERLMATIAGAAAQDPNGLVSSLTEAVRRFEAGAPPEDDVTLLAVRYRGC